MRGDAWESLDSHLISAKAGMAGLRPTGPIMSKKDHSLELLRRADAAFLIA